VTYRDTALFQVKDPGDGRSVRLRTLGLISDLNNFSRRWNPPEIGHEGRWVTLDSKKYFEVLPIDCGKQTPEAVAEKWALRLKAALSKT